MHQIKAPGDRIFEAFLGDMRNFTDPDFLKQIRNIPRASVRSMDYHTRHYLSPQFESKTESVTLRQGWIFVSTNISVSYEDITGGSTHSKHPPLIKIRQLEKADGGIQGATQGQPPENSETLGFISAPNGYGPGQHQPDFANRLTEPKSFFRIFGDSTIYEVTALNKFNRNMIVDVILTGWEIKNYG
jgi:hypothetical protein